MKFLYVLAFVSLALASRATADTNQVLERLCRLKKDAPKVTKVAEVKEMIKALKENQVACEQKTADAIKALEPVVELQNVCSEDATDTMVDFWKNYVRTKSDGRKYLPKQLRKFFIAYGLQMSKLCKIAMIEQLEKATSTNQITTDDIDLVTERLRGFVSKLFNDRRVENLLAIIQAYKRDGSESTKVNMEPLRKEIYDRVRERCAKKFKPVYDSLITPVVRLAAIGINYQGDSINEQMKEFYKNQLYKDWFAVVMACETSSLLIPISVPKIIEDGTGNHKMITFLDEEDLAELQKRGLAVEPAIETPANYALQVSVSDLALDETDADLIHSLKNYGGMLKDLNKFRLRMMKKAPYLLRTLADRKAVQFGLHPSKSMGRAKNALTKFGGGSHGSQTLLIGFCVLVAAGAVGAMVAALVLTHGFAMLLILIVSAVVFLAMASIALKTAAEMDKSG